LTSLLITVLEKMGGWRDEGKREKGEEINNKDRKR
jgi:hypothetical protein